MKQTLQTFLTFVAGWIVGNVTGIPFVSTVMRLATLLWTQAQRLWTENSEENSDTLSFFFEDRQDALNVVRECSCRGLKPVDVLDHQEEGTVEVVVNQNHARMYEWAIGQHAAHEVSTNVALDALNLYEESVYDLFK